MTTKKKSTHPHHEKAHAHMVDDTDEGGSAGVFTREPSPDSTAVGGVEVIRDDDAPPLHGATTIGATGASFTCLKQADERWHHDFLLNPASNGAHLTIGAAGCLLTCLAMAANWLLGKSWTPPEVNELAKQHGACSGPLVVVESLAKALGLVALESERYRSSVAANTDETTIGVIRRAFDAGKICILHVDLNSAEPHGDIYGDHFVVAVERDGTDLLCADPAPGSFCHIDEQTLVGDSVWTHNEDGTPRTVKHLRVVGVIPVSVVA